MSNDLNDEQMLLASAYLDGVVTSAERAQVDANPTLIAEVERLRSVRTLLSADAVTPISTRERHLAAALDAWDRLPDADRAGDHSGELSRESSDPAAAAGAATVTAPTPLADRRGRQNGRNAGTSKTSGWMLTAAAALLVVAGGGIVASRVNSGSDDSSDATDALELPAQSQELRTEAADESVAADAPAEDVAVEEFDVAPQVEAGIDSGSGRPDDIESIDSPETLARFATAVLAEEARLATAGAPAEEPAAADEPADTLAADDANASAEVLETADLTCGLVDRIIADAEYGTGIYPAAVAVGVNADETEVIAYRIETCEVVARAPIGG